MSSDPDAFPNATPIDREPPRRRRTCLVLTLIAVVLGFSSLLVCCGGIYYLSQGTIGLAFLDQVNAMPPVTDRVGRVERIAIDIPSTLQTFQDYPDHLVLEVHGVDGTVTMLVLQDQDARIQRAYFYDPDGNHELIATEPPRIP